MGGGGEVEDWEGKTVFRGGIEKISCQLTASEGGGRGVMRITKNLMGASGKFYRDITRIIRRQTFPPPSAFRKLRKKKQKRRGK